MKKVVLMISVALALALPTQADYYLAGEFNGWDAGSDMMSDNGDGTYSLTISGLTAGQRQEFKVTDGTWDWAHPGANSWYYADGSGEVTVTFDTNAASDGWLPDQNRIGVSADPGDWTVVGNFQGWNNANAATAMTDQGGGIYKLSQALVAGSYDWKVVKTGTWDAIGSDGRTINAGNVNLMLAEDATVDFYVDAYAGTVKADIVPEPATMALLGLGSLLAIRRRK